MHTVLVLLELKYQRLLNLVGVADKVEISLLPPLYFSKEVIARILQYLVFR